MGADHRYLVRIRSLRTGEPVGAGVLLQGRLVLTCAHVVNTALGRPQFSLSAPDEAVVFDLPAQPELGRLTARVAPATWTLGAEDEPDDLALLSLDSPVLAPLDTPPLRTGVGIDQDFRCHGFPDGREEPVLAVGTVQGPMGPEFGWHQLVSRDTTGYRVERGFSGTPVWSSAGSGSAMVIGIVVSEDSDPDKMVAGMLPLSRIARTPLLSDALAESALFDADAYSSHWEPAVRGSRSARPGWYFTGRRTVLAEVTRWLADRAGDEIGCVITGPPGSGKSAVLARLATASSAAFRSQHPQAWRDAPPETLPAIGSIQVAVHARDKGLAEICAAVAAAAGYDEDQPEQLVALLAARDEPFTLLIDALDEARDGGHEITQSLLQPLLVAGDPRRLRLLVGARPQLLSILGSGFRTIELDDPAYAELADLQTYTRARLADGGSPVDAARVEEIADRIAASAFPLFLVAQLTTDALQKTSLDQFGPGALPSTVPQAMELYLLRSFRPEEARKAQDLLRPLALVQGDGLPADELWASLAGGLAERRYDAEAVAWLIERAPALLARSRSTDGPRYRLFHASFAEGLAASLEPRAGAFFEALLDTVPLSPGGRRNWPAAPRYLRDHLAHHAQRAGRLADLGAESGYLAVADPTDLLAAQGSSGHLLGREVSQVLAALTFETLADEAADRSPTLALRLLFRDRPDLATELLKAVPPNRWRPLWFDGTALPSDGESLPSGHQGAVRAVAWVPSEEGTRIVSCAEDGSLILWSVDTRSVEVKAFADAHIGGAATLTVIFGAQTVVSGGADGLAFWDSETLELLGTEPNAHDAPVSALHDYEVNDEPVVVSGAIDGTLRIWRPGEDGPVGDELVRAHVGAVVGIGVAIFDPSYGPRLISVGTDGVTRFWDPVTGEPLGQLEPPVEGAVTSAALAEVGDGMVILYGTADGAVVQRRLTPDGEGLLEISTTTKRLIRPRPVSATAVLHRETTPYAAFGVGAEVLSFDVADTENELFVSGVQGISALHAFVDGAYQEPVVAAGGTDGTLRVWACSGFGESRMERTAVLTPGFPDMGQERSSRPTAVTAVAVTPTPRGTVAVTAGGGSAGYRYEIGNTRGQWTRRYSDQQPVVTVRWLLDGTPAGPSRAIDATGVLALAVDSDPVGRLRIAAGSRDGQSRRWIVGEEEISELQLVKRRESSFNMAGAMTAGTVRGRAGLATAASEGGVWFLELDGSKPSRKWRKQEASVLALGRLGALDVAVTWGDLADPDNLHVWDFNRGRRISTIRLPHPAGGVSALAIRDSLLVAGGTDGTVTVLRLDARAVPFSTVVHSAHTGPVNVLCSLGIGEQTVVVSGGQDGVLRFWPLSTSSTHPESIPVGTPILSACEAGEGKLLVGTGFGALALAVGIMTAVR
ncbi:AAA family ATPase [Kribbella catacumbae]|uniref:AAA family ATPase n=1 Tax=Kribbella catacumbae TaxID=460086 RepID=UPI000369FE9D|nr:AAA family ATPase [Kribbella catacumbae]